MFIAVEMGDANCAQLLINAGANVTAVLSNGDTLMPIATRLGYIDCMNLLINAGALWGVEAVDDQNAGIE
ncbi:ankyrin repeat domain-containing protein [Endozoicomonas sp. ALC020]|uniref:ankyrin repeat domain-containing protein n=1 Tax=unclassified Endozoicomonas TaxID=2644528 RepID=UPI003BAEB383